jgi:hypothetical protein
MRDFNFRTEVKGSCYTCTHFAGRLDRGYSLCARDPRPHVQADPKTGCAEPGSDDEPPHPWQPGDPSPPLEMLPRMGRLR